MTNGRTTVTTTGQRHQGSQKYQMTAIEQYDSYKAATKGARLQPMPVQQPQDSMAAPRLHYIAKAARLPRDTGSKLRPHSMTEINMARTAQPITGRQHNTNTAKEQQCCSGQQQANSDTYGIPGKQIPTMATWQRPPHRTRTRMNGTILGSNAQPILPNKPSVFQGNAVS